jgi:hypothetical protein
MYHRVYSSLEHDPNRFGRMLAGDEDASIGTLLDLLAEQPCSGSEAEEIEAFLMQRQSHVLGRADRAFHE